jgi:hypothetical protein
MSLTFHRLLENMKIMNLRFKLSLSMLVGIANYRENGKMVDAPGYSQLNVSLSLLFD